MRIGIIGSQSVGKTTLMNVLRSEPIFTDYTICNELTRKVREMGFIINEDGNDRTQKQIILEHFYNLLMYDRFLTDRTLVDCAVYTQWLYDNKKVSRETYEMANQALHRNAQMYDLLFFIEPEFKVVNDGIRSPSPQWQEEINILFKAKIDEYKIPVVKLSGSVTARADLAIKETIKKLNEHIKV